jgi:isoquinoline 1-oxidoreductase alpha subunit
MPFRLNVNNQVRTVDVPAEMPLLWVLRDVLDLKGAKYSCGMGVCGAYTVLVDGRTVRSCITRVGSVENGAITTIEGLADTDAHPVQRAWEELDVAQCGYCQTGQILAATALLSRTAQPTDADIDEAMSEASSPRGRDRPNFSGNGARTWRGRSRTSSGAGSSVKSRGTPSAFPGRGSSL